MASKTTSGANGVEGTIVSMSWADYGHNVVPLIYYINDTSGNIGDSINNDIVPVWLHATDITRTGCKIYMEA